MTILAVVDTPTKKVLITDSRTCNTDTGEFLRCDKLVFFPEIKMFASCAGSLADIQALEAMKEEITADIQALEDNVSAHAIRKTLYTRSKEYFEGPDLVADSHYAVIHPKVAFVADTTGTIMLVKSRADFLGSGRPFATAAYHTLMHYSQTQCSIEWAAQKAVKVATELSFYQAAPFHVGTIHSNGETEFYQLYTQHLD